MKRKLLSLLLVITLLAVTVSTGLPTILAAEENLLTNGDFSDYSGYTPANWNIIPNSTAGASAEIIEDVQISDGVTANALKITTTKDASGGSAMSTVTYGGKIKIEKNASYTMTYWVKVKKITGLRTYMFEPNYIAKDGTAKTDEHAQEGQNIYSYAYDDPNHTTRVIRTDVQHSWTIAETGTAIDNSKVSMFLTRTGSTNQVLTPDYPATNREGEWLQVIHTFATGNTSAHEAEVSYEIRFPGAVDGEVWLADFKMNVVKSDVEFYSPAVNDDTLGCTTENVALMNGKLAEITAKAYGENKFDGWFVDGELVSEEETLTFTYDPTNPPKYEARFTKADWGIDGSYENDANGLVAQSIVEKTADWTDTAFISSSKDSLHFIDSSNKGAWRKAEVTTEMAHSGKKSLLYSGQYGAIGRKFTGLQTNTDYIISVYAHTVSPVDTSDLNKKGVSTRYITAGNKSYIKSTGSSLTTKSDGEDGVILKYWEPVELTDGWTEISVQFNSGNNTEIIFWLDSSGYNAKLYLDDYSIARLPVVFKPAVNDTNLGSVTCESTEVFPGAEVTVTAKSVNSSVFKGWYVGDELVSSELTFTFTYEEKFKNLTAKFEAGVNSLPDYSFESYTNDYVLAQMSDIYYDNDTSLWNEALFKSTSKDGNNKFFIDSDWSKYGKAIATTAQAHTGSFSIKMSPNSRSVGYKLEGLDKNTKYTISFYAMTQGTTDSTTSTVGNIAVTDADQSCIVKNPNGKLGQRTEATGTLGMASGAGTDCRGSWKKYSVRFNTKDSTDVIVWVRPEGAGTQLYIDDLTIDFSPKEFKPVSGNSGLGTVTPNDYIECSDGQPVTVTAAPYPDAVFTGWYVGDELISEETTFTFNYDDKYQGLTAVFVGAPGTISNPGFEYYQNGQVLASYNDYNDPKFNNNPPWYVDTTYRTDTSLSLTVTNARAHTGEKSVVNNVPYRYTGLDIEGLQPNTDYVVSFYAYITGVDALPGDNDQNPKNVTSAFIMPKGEKVVYQDDKGNYVNVSSATSMGSLAGQVDCYNKWEKVEVMFTTTDDVTDVTLWVNFSGKSANLYMDDFAIFQSVEVICTPDLGGEVSSSLNSKYVLIGSEVTVEAKPFEGNTFAGWFIGNECVSTSRTYTFNADKAVTILAKFDGYNKPATDMFAINGNDGTFENGTVSGWEFYHKTDGTSWCWANVSSKLVYEGQKSLEVNARYRTSILHLNSLALNTDYRLSFYVNQPDTDPKAKIENMAIVGENDKTFGDAGTIFTSVQQVCSNSGWNRIDMYFNSGNNTAANLVFSFSAENVDNFSDRLYIDNLSLHRFEVEKEVINGGFDEDKYNWIGDGAVVSDADNKVLSLGANETVFQDLKVDAYSTYTVSFKAKGKLTAAAQDIAKFDLNVKNYISSVSYLDAEGAEWTEYSYKVYTGVHQALNLVFAAGAEGAMIDDVAFTKNIGNQGSILEQIDFETERFGLTSATDDSVYSIYTATENDPYVYSGNKSLKFTYNELLSNTSKVFNEAWLSYQPGIGNNLKISMKYKIVGGREGGFINLTPEYSGTYGAEDGFEHMADNEEWQSLTFYVNNTTYAVFKAKIASIISGTTADFYVDDIIISVAPAMVIEENSKLTYCERLYNAVDNEGFENAVTNKDWKGLPSTAKIVKGDALKGSHFLRASKGTHYVLAVPVKASTEYYFAASIRGTAATVGSIGISVNPEGTEYYANRDEVPASIVNFNSAETGWKRSGFKFTTDANGLAYVVIDVKSGALDIDSVMMFTSEYGYRYDPNDYTIYVPYDYNNLKSATTVINGGFGAQPYYKGDSDGVVDENGGSPSTGDSVAMPVMLIVLAVVASTVLMLIRKRKEGAENA